MAGTIGAIPAIVAAENDIHPGRCERSNEMVKNVIRIIDEPAGVSGLKVLKRWMENSPTVAHDERIEESRRPYDGELQVGKQGGIGRTCAMMIGDGAGQEHREIEQGRVGRHEPRVVCAQRAVTDTMLTRLRH